jgi:1,4-dihydroxy-2-naphthoate octaprenyltransferase
MFSLFFLSFFWNTTSKHFNLKCSSMTLFPQTHTQSFSLSAFGVKNVTITSVLSISIFRENCDDNQKSRNFDIYRVINKNPQNFFKFLPPSSFLLHTHFTYLYKWKSVTAVFILTKNHAGPPF